MEVVSSGPFNKMKPEHYIFFLIITRTVSRVFFFFGVRFAYIGAFGNVFNPLVPRRIEHNCS